MEYLIGEKSARPASGSSAQRVMSFVTGIMILMSVCVSGETAAQGAAPASVTRTLEIPQSLMDAPFDSPKTLDVPPGFGIRLLARVEGARFMAVAPNGDILVSNPASGNVVLLREPANDVPENFIFASGLKQPHDMVFHQIGNVIYLYIAESNRVSRSIYTSGDTHIAAREVVVDNLPSADLPELGGAYGHQLKNIALSSDHKLYISIASACNACVEDTLSNPVRGAIYQYNADGTGQRLFARGIRNAEGLDLIPGTNDLWLTINGSDNVLYPFENDFDGDGASDFGKLIEQYVDDNPPELFTRIRDGGNYGWPFCNAVANPEMSNLELVRDVEFNQDGARLDCAIADRPSKGLGAHSAPLGFSFLHASRVPAAYRNGAVIALHGCWNCTSLRAGYRVAYIPFDSAGNAGTRIDLINGFVTDPDTRSFWGRPVDVVADSKGNILVSDDYTGAIYQLYPLLP
ncbi:MAG: sugar dehydrogenase [Pseudomonadota bacterium]